MQELNQKITSLYLEYKEFEKVVQNKNKEISDKGDTVKALLEGKTPEELEDVLLHIYVDTLLYNKDLQLMFFKLITTIDIYSEFFNEPLNEEVLDFYNSMKNWLPKRVFVLEKNEIVETEEGTLEAARKDFIESDFFKNLLEQTSK